MLKLCSEIFFRTAAKQWLIPFVSEVKIKRDMSRLTAECSITIPKAIKWQNEPSVPLKRGDEVIVRLGYDDELRTVFVGYIKDVSTKTPVVIKCEDEMFMLKQMPAKKNAYRSVDIETLLKEQYTGVDVKVFGEQRLGQYRITADTVAGLLADLRKSGIKSFFLYENDKPVLYSGVVFERESTPSQVFSTGINIIDDTSLEQRNADASRIRIKAISIMPDNTKIKVEVGDEDGEWRTLHAYNKTEEELTAWAKQELKDMKREGLAGSFTTFGYMPVKLLDCIGIKIDGEKRGVYQVSKNELTFGMAGYRQKITLGRRVAD